ncbi:hypothetical protein [Pseudomonas sp.]|uniref:hypothetical protein n=1 Tax=Pseudomonas sp. TaxID=306 RepID=UPI0035659789
MTEHAGEVERGLLWKQEHLAPMPIPTGQPASDLMNIIWRKNEAYLDIGSFAMAAGWLTLHMGTVLVVAISAWVASTGDYWLSLAMLAFMGGGLMGTLWYLYIKQWRKPLTPPIRFNRQRREVCITEPDGSYWFVPWERVYAIAPSVTNLGTYGATKHGCLLLWFPLKGQEHETYGPDKKGWVLMVNPGGGISSMAQWECIRSFMETGPDAAPEPSVIRNKGMSLWQSFTYDFMQAVKSRGWLLAFLWEGLGSLVFNGFLLEHLLRKKLAHIPDLTAPEVVEWSKPLPPAQWAKRSPELELAIAKREAELAEQ